MNNSRGRYQMLPTDDRTPALEINLNQQQQQQQDAVEVPAGGTTATATTTVTVSSNQTAFVNVDLNDNNNSNINSNRGQTPPPPPTVFKDNNGTTFIYIPTNNGQQTSNELPTYEEVLYQKQHEANGGTNCTTHTGSGINQQPHSFIALPPMINLTEISDLTSPHNNSTDLNNEVGTDCIFLTSFMVSFFFNWIGFITCICLMPTIAGKYGALSGFGLSMVKWATIVRYQSFMVNLNDIHQRLFFWIFILAGFYLFFRGLITYVKIKYNPNAYLRRRGEAEWWLFR